MPNKATVAIVGAGPLGIELAIALKKAGISFFIFDKGQIAQAIYDFPVETLFFSSAEKISIPGFPIQTLNQQKSTREEYLAYIRAVSMHYELQFNTFEEVSTIEKHVDGFLINTKSTDGNQEYSVQYVVLATGGTSYPRSLDVPGESLPHVAIKMDDPHHYFQKKVVIIGGRNSAAEAALRCYHAGAYPTLIVRQEQFEEGAIKYWILPELLSLIQKGNISCYYGCDVQEILPGKVVLRECSSLKQKEIEADFVIKAIGFHANMTLCQQLGVHLSTDQHIPEFADDTMETNIEGVYVLGTIVGGTQKRYRVYIENTHVHVPKIVQSIARKLGLCVAAMPLPQPSTSHLEE